MTVPQTRLGVWKERSRPTVLRLFVASMDNALKRRFVIVKPDSDLLQIVLRRHLLGRDPGLMDGHHQERHKDRECS